MEMKSGVDHQLEAPEGGLRELVLRWFTGTQAPLILHNGNFPDWFVGFTARRDAEDLLRDKALGCFLIRLSDKAIGYILSYKGADRCRHFVITQNEDGLFVISGDCQPYHSLSELIEHYKVSPIQPFGEYLTGSCCEVNKGEVYDVVTYNTKAESAVSVQALRSLWDQKDHSPIVSVQNQRIQQQTQLPTPLPPALPPKSKNRKLTGTVSADAKSFCQVAPPVPKRGVPLSFILNGSPCERSTHPTENPTDVPRAERLIGNTKSVLLSNTSFPGDLCPAGPPGAGHSPVESRSKSLPGLDNISPEDEEEEQEYSNNVSRPAFSSSTSHSPTLVKRVTCHTYSLHQPRPAARLSSSTLEQHQDQISKLNPLYQATEGSAGSSASKGDAMYAEVPRKPATSETDTYEQIPGQAPAAQANTYESLEDIKTKMSKTTWGKNNMKWKKFLPDYKKK